jgi:hypothetical protein
LPQPRCLPAPHPPFVPPFSVFTWADHPFQGNRQSRAGVLIHSSDRYPLGNCDWPGLETFPDYLTRLGTVSCLASLTAQLLLRVTDDARTPPEELVNPASAPNFYLQLTEGPRQPACLDLSPVAWAYPRNFGASLLTTAIRPGRRFITVANKRRQTTVILTVPPVLKPCGFIFMEPGFVSYRLIRPVILKSLLVKLSCG